MAPARSTLGLLAVLLIGQATAQFASPFARIPPSYGQSCTVVNADGSFSQDPSLCPNYRSLGEFTCVTDPYRNGASYCGIGNADCHSDIDCAVSTYVSCQRGQCGGGYGQAPIPIAGSPAAACANGGYPGNDNLCMTDGAICSLKDSQCASGYCKSRGSSYTYGYCSTRETTVGASCQDQFACGTLAGTSTPLYCRSSDSTCQPVQAAGSDCSADGARSCANLLACSTAAAPLGQQFKCLPATVGASCASPTTSCGMTAAGTQLYCRSSDQTCQAPLTTIGADCRGDPVAGCTAVTNSDGSTTPLYCSLPTYKCAAQVGAGASCSSNPQQACTSPLYCSSNTQVCLAKTNSLTGSCSVDPYAQCGTDPNLLLLGYSSSQLYPDISTDPSGNQYCVCYASPAPTSEAPPPGAFAVTTVGGDCSADPTFACGYSASGVKLYCALSTNTCQEHVTTVGGSCAYDYLGTCGVLETGSAYTQLYPSIPVGSSGHAECTCVTQSNVVVRPSSRARARVRERRNLSLCPGSFSACPVGNGFECIDTESNLEQCGGCSENGGVDCTALVGVSAVGCIGGRCEVWACEAGLEYSPEQEACV